MINLYSFAGHLVSIATIQLCCYSRTVCVVWLFTNTGSRPALTFRIYQANTGCNNGHSVIIFVPLYLAYLFPLAVFKIYLLITDYCGFLHVSWVCWALGSVGSCHASSVCFLGLPLHICWAALYCLTSHWFYVVSILLSFILDHFYCSVFKFSNHFFFGV